MLNFKTVLERLPPQLKMELRRHMCAARMLALRVRPFLSLYIEELDIDIDPDDVIAVAALRPAQAAVAARKAGASIGDGGCGGVVVSRGCRDGTRGFQSRRGRGRGEPPSRSSPLRDIARAARRILVEGTAVPATGVSSSSEAGGAEGQADAVEVSLPRLIREFRVGDACLAQHCQDNKWYSGVVVQVHTGAAAAVHVDYGLDSASARFESFLSEDFGGRVLNRSFHVSADRMPEGWQLRYTLADQLPVGWRRRRRRWVGTWDCFCPQQGKWLPTSTPAVAAAASEAATKGSVGGRERAKRLLRAQMKLVAANACQLAPYLFLWPGEPGYPTSAVGGAGRRTSASR